MFYGLTSKTHLILGTNLLITLTWHQTQPHNLLDFNLTRCKSLNSITKDDHTCLKTINEVRILMQQERLPTRAVFSLWVRRKLQSGHAKHLRSQRFRWSFGADDVSLLCASRSLHYIRFIIDSEPYKKRPCANLNLKCLTTTLWAHTNTVYEHFCNGSRILRFPQNR